MRPFLLWPLALAACTFDHGVPMTGGGGSANPDGAVAADVAVTVDAAPDGPPTTCPDDDGDSVCNAVDDWPCGVKPTAPPTLVSWSRNNGDTTIQITNVNLDSTGRLAVATSQENVSLRFDYDITDTACAGNCIDQLEIGWLPGGKIACPFDGAVSKSSGADGTASTTVKAPTTKQVYDLRVELGQNYSCWYGGASGWWDNQAPTTSRTIAKLCVH
jgi:hypothetical protein